jgi:cytoskeleton protein RodZ
MQDSDALRGAPRPQAPGLGLGERLRSARKARAISVAQAAEALRLEEESVLALEEERFEALGAPVFVRGHLRRYAQLVGLQAEAVLEAYRAAVPDSDALPRLARPREQADGLRVGPWAYWIVAGLVLAAMVVALSDGGGDEPGGPQPASSPPALPPPPAAPAGTAAPPADAGTTPPAGPPTGT